MGDESVKEGVIPSGAFDFAPEGSLVGMTAEDVESELSQGGEVLWGVVLSAAGAVLVEGDVERPVKLVLDGPMASHDLQQPIGGQRCGEQEVAHDRGLELVIDLPMGLDAGDGGEVAEVAAFGEVLDNGDHGAAAFDPAMVEDRLADGLLDGAVSSAAWALAKSLGWLSFSART